jgi:hypothetical protein
MYSWQTPTPWRSRLLFIGSVAALITLIVVFYWSPQTLDRVFGVIQRHASGGQASAAPPPEAEPAKPTSVRKTTRRRQTVLNSVAPEITADSTDPASEESPNVRRSPQDRSLASVKTDGAAVYSSNTSRSSVLQVLRKGDKVESNLEVLDREGRWSLIRTDGLKQSGFVRTEDLERPETSEAQSEPAE